MTSDPIYMRIRSPSTPRLSFVPIPGLDRDIPPDDPPSTPQRRRVARSRSTQGRFQTLPPHTTRSQVFDTGPSEDNPQDHGRHELRQDMNRKLANAELHQVKQQLGEARHKIAMLERKCDQQARDLTKVRTENEKHLANIKCLNDQIRQMKHERSRSHDRFPRPSSTSGQFERQWNSVRQTSYTRGRVRNKEKDLDTDERIFHKQALDNLMNKCNEEFDLIKSQLKSQEAAFQGLQRGFSLERLPGQEIRQNDKDKTNGVQRQSRDKKRIAKHSKSSSMDSVLSQQDQEGAIEKDNSVPQTKQAEVRDSVVQTEKNDESIQLENQDLSPEFSELKNQVQDQQNLISEQWKLIKNKEEAIHKEKVKLDNEWKFRTDELEIQLKDAEDSLKKERDTHTKMLSKVQTEAMQNKQELEKKLGELASDIHNMSFQQSKAQQNASVLEKENANLKGMLQKYQHELQEQKQQLQMQYMTRNNLTQQNNSMIQPMHQQPMHQPPMHQPMHQPVSPPNVHTHPPTPTLSRSSSLVNSCWIVPKVMYQDERLAKMVKEVLFRLDKRAELAVLGGHEIMPHHSGRILIPVIGSAGVVANVQAALEKVNLGNVAVIVLVFYPLAPHNCNLYTTTKNRLGDCAMMSRCLAVIDLVVWHSVLYDCEANDNGIKELRDIANR